MQRDPNRLGENRAGPGTRKGAGACQDPAVVAARLEKMRAAHKEWRDRRKAMGRVIEDLAHAGIGDLVHRLSNRHWEVAMWHLAGYPYETIAVTMGFANRSTVMQIIKRPEVQRLITLVREAQLQRVIEGEFGVRAQAKAAAPKIMRRVIEKAGGIEEAGRPVGMAARDADQLRAADLALTVSGDKVERHQHLHAHLMREMSDEEIRHLAERGEWPERYRGVVQRLTGPEPDAPSGT